VNNGRTYDSFFDIRLGVKKETTKKQYDYTFKDFGKFRKAKYKKDWKFNLEQTVKEFKNSETDDIIDTLQEWINQSK